MCVCVEQGGVTTEGHHGKSVLLRSYKQEDPSEYEHIRIRGNVFRQSLDPQTQS